MNARVARWFQRCHEFTARKGAVDRAGPLPYVRIRIDPGSFSDFSRPMVFTFLLVIHALVAALLVAFILMQKSEGGGLTSGGSPAGLMSARGAADFLTRTTAILGAAFIGLSILLAVLAATRQTATVDASAAVPVRSGPPMQTAPAPDGAAPLAGAAQAAQESQAANLAAPADNSVPLAR